MYSAPRPCTKSGQLHYVRTKNHAISGVGPHPRCHWSAGPSDDVEQRWECKVTVVWVAIEGDEIVSAHLHLHHKVKNIRRDPRVAVSLLGPSKNALGLQEYLVVYGEARVTEGGAVPLLHRLARLYMGPDARLPLCGTPPPTGIRDPHHASALRGARMSWSSRRPSVGSWCDCEPKSNPKSRSPFTKPRQCGPTEQRCAGR